MSSCCRDCCDELRERKLNIPIGCISFIGVSFARHGCGKVIWYVMPDIVIMSSGSRIIADMSVINCPFYGMLRICCLLFVNIE